MFNLKEKMSRMASLNVDRDSSSEVEFNVVQERIRRVKLEIMNKLQTLKTKRMINQATLKSQSTSKKTKFAPIKVAVTELKDATELINRELVQQR